MYSTRSVVAPHVSPSSRFLLVSFNPLNNRHDVNVNYNPKDKTRKKSYSTVFTMFIHTK